MKPAQLQRLLEEGLVHHKAKRFAEASALYAQVRKAAPNLFDGWHLSGAAAFHEGKLEEAVPMLLRALRLQPGNASCEFHLGLALGELGRHAEAESRLRSAVKKLPTHADAWRQLGDSLRKLDKLADAIECYQRLIALQPDNATAHELLGELIVATQGVAAGEPHFRRAVELDPGQAVAWSNLGVALTETGRLDESLACFARALSIDPVWRYAHTGRALALLRAFRMQEALPEYAEVLALDPHDVEARSARLMVLNYLPGRSREEVFAEHAAFGEVLALKETATLTFAKKTDPERRLRVGFLSPDLRAHSVAWFIEPLLRHLDRTHFEIFLYHDHTVVDATSERLRALAYRWRHFAGLSNDTVEKTIRADASDILVDLAGHESFNRLTVFARRLAPVQVTYLAYPNTTGLRTMDYRLVDAITDPGADDDRFHTEKLVRFAPTAWVYGDPADAPAPAAPPSANGATVTFGCFNHFTKVTDETLQNWNQLLSAVPGARLLLKSRGLGLPEIQTGVRTRLRAAGLADDRVTLLDQVAGTDAHLAQYALMDVALDTFPYHGTTTTCEALWMGVPVVSLAGDRHASRVGASLLTAIGHPEWIARDWADYRRIATELSSDATRLAALRGGLREQMRQSPLLDHAGQAARFGEALRNCWRTWCASAAGSPADQS